MTQETAPALKLLLIEDHRADAVLLQDALTGAEPARFKLTWADRLEKGLAHLQREAFDAVLLDLTLPDSSGLDTLDRIHAAADSLPIIVVTGLEDEALAMQAIRQGAQDYIVKGTLNGHAMARCILYAIDRLGAEQTVREAQRRQLRAQADLQAARVARDTINAMSEGVFLLSRSGHVLSANPALERLSGCQVTAIIGRNLTEFLLPMIVPETLVEQVRKDLADVLRGQSPELLPFTLRALDGRLVPVAPSAAWVRNPEGQPQSVVITLRDISSLKRAQQALEESERKYRELVENANSIIMRITPQHVITFFNEYAETFFGYSKQEVLGRNVLGTITPEIDSEGRDLRQLTAAITADPERYANNENENQCKDGRRVWVHWANRAIRDAQGAVVEFLCVGTDITRRKQMEAEAVCYQEQLHALAKRVATAEEQERWQISRYIHDTIIQNLSLASMRLGACLKSSADTRLAPEAGHLRTTRKLVDEAVAECRTVMSELTPPLLYELGLVHALKDLAEKLQEKHGIKIGVETQGSFQTMAVEIRSLLFQSTRELVMNALKHAGACEIDVRVTGSEEAIMVRVQDNGRGFTPVGRKHPTARQGGFGLFNIRERIEGMGGCLDIASTPGQGTTAVLSLSVSKQK